MPGVLAISLRFESYSTYTASETGIGSNRLFPCTTIGFWQTCVQDSSKKLGIHCSNGSITSLLMDSGCINEWGEMNNVYVQFFSKHLPVRSVLGAIGFAVGARVEIECTAVLK